jgi:hypothetical protein
MARRSNMTFLMYSTVPFSTMPSDRACPERPGTRSVSRSKPSRMACRRFCSGPSQHSARYLAYFRPLLT